MIKHLPPCPRIGLLALFSAALLSWSWAAMPVDPSNRENSRIFYNAVFPASANVPTGWTGNTGSGNAGSTSQAFRDAVQLRVNFYRAMSGVDSSITFNSTWNSMCQSAALMMSANNALSHSPSPLWSFYSASGATAAGNSNLALSTCGIASIDSYMEDPGSSNAAAGHRRWLLYPQTKSMGTGDVGPSGSYQPANSLWVIDNATFALPRPVVRDDFVAWPPKGYIPYQLIFPRWSFSYPAADFSAASVTLLRNGVPLSVRKEQVYVGYGENTLIFIPDNLDPNSWSGPVRPVADSRTTVTISNVRVAGVARTFSYDVISFDPAKTGTGSVAATITGPASPSINASNIYNVNDLPLATGYQWKTFSRNTYSVLEGAETAGTVVSTSPGGYSLRASDVRATGSYSYHLAHPNFQVSSFKLNPTFIPKAGAVLNFKSQLGYATSYQTGRVQVSLDGGASWQDVWTKTGNNNAENAFQSFSVSLAAYLNKEIQVRFYYDLRMGSAYTQTSTNIGWYVDDISFSSVDEISGVSLSSVSPATSFAYHPAAVGTYGIEVRPQVYGQYFLPWAGLISVNAVNGVPAKAAGSALPFLAGEAALGNGVYYLQLASGNIFGYYSYLADANYIYHFDLGYEYLMDAKDGAGGIYLYDFASGHFFYTSSSYPFPYLYDFTLQAVLYYYADAAHPGHYTTGPRYFYNSATGQIITQ